MGIKLTDMDKVEAMRGGRILALGPHHVVIDRAEEGTSSGGHPQVEIEFSSTTGAGNIRDWLVFSPRKEPGLPTFAEQKARALMDAVDIISESGEMEFPTAKLPGRKLVIVVGEEPDFKDPSRMRSRVVQYKSLEAARAEGEIPGDTKDLPSGNGPVADDDSIPF